MKTLLQQIDDVGAEVINPQWVNACSMPEMLNELAIRGFVQNWPRDSFKARVVLRGLELMRRPGHCYITYDEPGLHET